MATVVPMIAANRLSALFATAGRPSPAPLEPAAQVNLPISVLPVRADARPATDLRMRGTLLSVQGATLDLLLAGPVDTRAGLLLAVEAADGPPQYVGVWVTSVSRADAGRFLLHAQVGGLGHELLQPENLTPRFDCETQTFTFGFPLSVLRQWVGIGVLQPIALGRLERCPRCLGMPAMRRGCPACGSDNCEIRPAGLAYACRSCAWDGPELAPVLRCLACAARLREDTLTVTVVEGFHVRRF